jgi:hypothetical protein
MRFQVLSATVMSMAVFWDVAPCGLAEIDRRFRGPYFIIRAMVMETISTSETSVNFYQTTRLNIPEDHRLQFL